MQEKYKKRYGMAMLVFLVILFGVTVAAVMNNGSRRQTTQKQVTSNRTVPEPTKTYDTEITGVVTGINTGLKNIKIYNISNDLEITLNYTGGTDVTSKNNNIMSMNEINLGDIVDASFVSEGSKLTKLQISPSAWEYKNVSKYQLNEADRQMQIGSRLYRYYDGIALFNGEKTVAFSELDEQDVLDVKGIGQNVYSIVLAKGHGYIRFSGYKDFIGGTVEVGNHIVMPIKKDMVIVAREGSYRLTMEHDDLKGIKYIAVARDEDITVDMSEYRKEAEQTVSVKFDIAPRSAKLYINDVETDYKKAVELPFGEYDIRVTARGYMDYTGTLIIGKDSKAYEKVSIDLVEAVVTEAPSAVPASSNTPVITEPPVQSTGQENTPSATPANGVSASPSPTSSGIKTDSSHVISIRSPIGAQVYVNGAYKGEVPVSFEKQIGTLSILLSRKGYQTKSYTVEVKDNKEDAVYQFSDMVPIGE